MFIMLVFTVTAQQIDDAIWNSWFATYPCFLGRWGTKRYSDFESLRNAWLWKGFENSGKETMELLRNTACWLNTGPFALSLSKLLECPSTSSGRTVMMLLRNNSNEEAIASDRYTPDFNRVFGMRARRLCKYDRGALLGYSHHGENQTDSKTHIRRYCGSLRRVAGDGIAGD
jgi:hypothetical protein